MTTWPEHWGYCHDAGNCCMEADWRKSCCERVYQCVNYTGCTTNELHGEGKGKCSTSAGSSSKIHGTLNGVGQWFVSVRSQLSEPQGMIWIQMFEFELETVKTEHKRQR